MCHVADHSTSEVSQTLGLSEATVRVHLFRAVRSSGNCWRIERVSSGARLSESGIQAAGETTAVTRSAVSSHPHLSDDRLIELDFDVETSSSDRAHCRSARPASRDGYLSEMLEDIETA